MLTNTIRAAGTDITLPGLSRVRLHLADGRLHTTATDRFRIHRDWTPLLDTTPAHLPDPLLLPTSEVATLRTLLPALREAPATLTLGAPIPAPNDDLREIRFTLGVRGFSNNLSLHSVVDPTLRFPDIAKTDAQLARWNPAGTVRLNPGFLADAAKLTHHGRPVSRHAGLTLRFRADRPDRALGAVRITHPGRPSFTADVMPIHIGDDDAA